MDELHNDDLSPTYYLIKRENYHLKLMVGDNRYKPHMYIAAISNDGKEAIIDPLKMKPIYGATGAQCNYFGTPKLDPIKKTVFSCSCEKNKSIKLIRFRVRSLKGRILGIENIPFEIKKWAI